MQKQIPIADLLLKVCKEQNLTSIGPNGYIAGTPPLKEANGNVPRGGTALPTVASDKSLDSLKASIFEQFHFNRTELLIISALYQQFTHTERPISVIHLLRHLFAPESSPLVRFHQLLKLALDGIIVIYRPGVPPAGGPINTGMLYADYNLEEGLSQNFSAILSTSFLNFLIDEQRPPLFRDGYKSNQEFLTDAFKCWSSAYKYFNVPANRVRIDMFDVRVDERFTNIQKRLEATSIDIPWQAFVSEYELEPNEQLAIMHLMDLGIKNQVSPSPLIERVVEPDIYHRDNITTVFASNGNLQSCGLIEIQPARFPSFQETVGINPDVLRRLVSATPIQSSVATKSIVSKDPAVTMMTPTKTIDQLILSDLKLKSIQSVIDSVSSDNQQWLQHCGLLPSAAGDNQEYGKQQTLVLLHGKPGIGKTLSAEVIASELGKDLMSVEISLIHGKFVGDSEKNLRRMFTTYTELHRKSDNPPVLLLNECDQFLSKRIANISHGYEQTMNTLQNMTLEFFENFTGILIATTNLVSNLDEAYSRRFTHKIELEMPEENERLKLWHVHIPEQFPLADDVDLELLAREYPFSGSQIKTVIVNAATIAARDLDTGREVTRANFEESATMERTGAFDDSSTKQIGFNL